MALTNAGRNLIASLLTGVGTVFNNANASIGVGNSSTAFDAAQTDLQGASKLRKGMDMGYPLLVDNVLTFRSTYAAGEANFAWEEWAMFNALAAGTMLNRVVEYNGTKLVGQTWVFETEITIALGV